MIEPDENGRMLGRGGNMGINANDPRMCKSGNTIDSGDNPDGSDGGYDSHGNFIVAEAMEEIMMLRSILERNNMPDPQTTKPTLENWDINNFNADLVSANIKLREQLRRARVDERKNCIRIIETLKNGYSWQEIIKAIKVQDS